MNKKIGFVKWYNKKLGIGVIDEVALGRQHTFSTVDVLTVDKHVEEGDKVSFIFAEDDYKYPVKNITLVLLRR